MPILNVNEVFYSLQGEGARAGTPSVFIRLSDCNLKCKFCDTEFETGKDYTLDALLQSISEYPCKEIVWTGGEPTLQLTDEIVSYFKVNGYYQCIETNGSHKVPQGIDYIACSPKVAEHVIKKSFPNGINELRYVRFNNQQIPKPSIKADYYYISPIFNGDKIDYENLNYCIKLCLDNPQWRLSIQSHKLIKVR